MATSPTIDRVAMLAESYAASILTDLLACCGSSARASASSASGGGFRVMVIVTPTDPAADRLDGLTECERDCLALLARVIEPMSAERVCRRLKKENRFWGLATVKRSLAKLRRQKLIDNSKYRPRGYSLPEASPIVSQTSKMIPDKILE